MSHAKRLIVVTSGRENAFECFANTLHVNSFFPDQANIIGLGIKKHHSGNYLIYEKKWNIPFARKMWKKDITLDMIRLLPDHKLMLGGKIKELKKQVGELVRLRSPDFVVFEIHPNMDQEENQILLLMVNSILEDVGRDHLLFLHVSNSPNLKAQETIDEKQKAKTVLEHTGIEPDIIINEYDFTWVR